MNTEQNKIRKAKKGEFEWRKLTIGFNEIEYDLCDISYVTYAMKIETIEIRKSK